MKRFNNKILIIALLVLVAAFVLTNVFRSPSLESNLDVDLLKIDTAGITEIRLYPESEGRKEVKLEKNGKSWSVSRNDKTATAEINNVNSLLRSLASLKPERMVSRKKEKWDNYRVGDTTAVQVKVLKNKEELANLYIGKESGGSTYLRKAGDNEVYATKGYLRTNVNKDFNSWRDKTFLKLGKDLITKITFQYPADSGFVAMKKNGTWMIGSEKADSVSMQNYLGKLRSKEISKFADDFSPKTDPDVTITIESGTATVATVKGWKEAFYKWILNSSVQENTYFSDEGPVVARDLFVGKAKLLSKDSNQ